MSPAPWLRGLLLLAVVVVPAAAAGPAVAQTGCTGFFNGIEAERIGSISSPLLLGADDDLVFSGTDAAGTTRASVAVIIGPLTLGRAAGTAPDPITDFSVSLPLANVSRDSVGLLHLRGVTDHCQVDAWLRLGGRSLLATTAGLIGAGLGLLGLAGQGLALVLRRSWSPWLAGEAGLFTGAGAALLGQQWGRLQLSGWSLIICIAIAVVAGVGLALLLRRRPAREPVAEQVEPPPVTSQAPPAAPTAAAPSPDRSAVPGPALASPTPGLPARVTAAPAPATDVATPPPAPAPSSAPLPYWAYVLADTPVLDLADYSRTVATLQPGTWYLVEREVGPWAQVEAAEGVEGWAPRRALRRET